MPMLIAHGQLSCVLQQKDLQCRICLSKKIFFEKILPVIAVIVGSLVGDVSQLILTSWISFGSIMMSWVRDNKYKVKEF